MDRKVYDERACRWVYVPDVGPVPDIPDEIDFSSYPLGVNDRDPEYDVSFQPRMYDPDEREDNYGSKV